MPFCADEPKFGSWGGKDPLSPQHTRVTYVFLHPIHIIHCSFLLVY